MNSRFAILLITIGLGQAGNATLAGAQTSRPPPRPDEHPSSNAPPDLTITPEGEPGDSIVTLRLDRTPDAAPAADEAAGIDQAEAGSRPGAGEQIAFSADRAEYQSSDETVTVTGDVRMNRNGYRIRADKVVWDRQKGTITAYGKVVMVSPQGDAVYTDSAELQDGFRQGAMQNLMIVLASGGRLAARSGQRNGDAMTLSDVAYSSCPVTDPKGCPERPSWQINAARVVYDPARRRVRFEKAQLEMFGIPLFTMSALNRPLDSSGSSGLLTPDVEYRNTNGFDIKIPYYIQLAPNRDITITPHIYSKVLPALGTTYRALTGKGAYQISAFGTYNRRIPTGGSVPTTLSRRDWRGYLDTLGRFQLSRDWNIHYSIRLVSDRTFLRRSGITRDDRLRSDITLERVTPANYFAFRFWGAETLRPGDPQGQQPLALPMLDWRRVFAAPKLGGTLTAQLNSLSLIRTSGQDTFRNFAALRWDRRFLLDGGQQLLLTTYGRGDVYVSRDNSESRTLAYRGKRGTQGRGVLTGSAELNWPFAGALWGGVQRIMPRIQIVATPSVANLRIPNEDSRSIELETTNLFALNRFPGYDRWEDGVRTTYGVEWGYSRRHFSFETTLGQSYRLTREKSLFPVGVGLRGRYSDIVGKSSVRYKHFVSVSFGYRLDKDSLKLRRSVVDFTVGGTNTFLSAAYVRLDRDIGPELEDLRNREELRGAGRLQLTRFLSVFGSAVVDMTNRSDNPLHVNQSNFRPVRTRVGIAYTDDCLELGFTWRRDYATTGDAKKGDTWLFRLAFRGFGR